jgi:hypothetical protein
MAITTGNFQDLVQLSQDTLYHLGPMVQIGNPLASTVTLGFSNSGGQLALLASQTANETVWLPNGGTILSNINVSAGTTSNNLSALVLSNSNNVSFGLSGSTITASAAAGSGIAGIAAGTQTATSGTVVYSNSNNVTFGMSNSSVVTASVTVASTQGSINVSAGTTSNLLSAFTLSNSNNVTFGLNASTITASVTVASTQGSINVSAGTTSNLLSAFTLSNSNGLSFGLNASTITAVYGGMSSWSNGQFATAESGGQNTLFFQPIIVPYAITVTNLLWLASQTNVATNSSGGLSVKAGLYALSGGTQITLLSTGSTNLTWTSGAPLSSNTGINYQQMSVASWNVTPGPYLFGWWISTQNSASMSFYGEVQQPVLSSGQVAAMSNLMVKGYSQATTNALPTSFGITNTASYIRTGATAAQQPTMIFQGT